MVLFVFLIYSFPVNGPYVKLNKQRGCEIFYYVKNILGMALTNASISTIPENDTGLSMQIFFQSGYFNGSAGIRLSCSP
jgi:hypothetical protein